jgi:hypothetical protein
MSVWWRHPIAWWKGPRRRRAYGGPRAKRRAARREFKRGERYS